MYPCSHNSVPVLHCFENRIVHFHSKQMEENMVEILCEIMILFA